jgi:hypothetical protein
VFIHVYKGKYIYNLFAPVFAAHLYSPVLVGGSDADSEGNWVWMDGTSFSFTFWKEGEPNGDTAENCLMLDNTDWKFEWMDVDCAEPANFVCSFPIGKFFPHFV